MEKEITLAVIVERIDNLCTATKLGFKGMHARQDKTNGNVKLNTESRLINSRPMTMLSSIITIIVTSVIVGGVAIIMNMP